MLVRSAGPRRHCPYTVVLLGGLAAAAEAHYYARLAGRPEDLAVLARIRCFAVLAAGTVIGSVQKSIIVSLKM